MKVCLQILALALVLGGLVLPTEAQAEPPLAMAEARLGQGLAVGGGSGESTWRLSPLSLSVLGSLAIRTDPWVSVYGGLLIESYDRASAGAILGIRLNPGHGGTRISAAGTAIAVPFTAYGVSVGVGRCLGLSRGAGFCTDLEATVFALGSDVPKGRVATQVQAIIGVAFDVY